MLIRVVFFLFCWGTLAAWSAAGDAAEDGRAAGPADTPQARPLSSGTSALPTAPSAGAWIPTSKEALLKAYPAQEADPMTADERLAASLWSAARGVSATAKSIGQTFGDYVREKQMERRQKELVERFYVALYNATRGLKLSADDYRMLVNRVEEVYIKNGETSGDLDAVYFREMQKIVKREYAEIQFLKARDGVVDTYYPGGTLKTRWNFRNGNPEGIVTTYYEDGEILHIDTYSGGRKMSRKKFDHEGKLEFEQVYFEDRQETAAEKTDAKPEQPSAPPPAA